MKLTEEMIRKLIADNEDNNIGPLMEDDYCNGYYAGYHDALVDLMDKLGIEHNEIIYLGR